MSSIRLPDPSNRRPPKDLAAFWEVFREYLQRLILSLEQGFSGIYDALDTETNPLSISLLSTSENYESGQRSVILVDSSSGDVTITLPEPSAATRRIYIVKKTSTDSNSVTVLTSAGANIDGDSSYVMSGTDYPAVRVLSNGYQYWTI